jgi:hypothetical protein
MLMIITIIVNIIVIIMVCIRIRRDTEWKSWEPNVPPTAYRSSPTRGYLFSY